MQQQLEFFTRPIVTEKVRSRSGTFLDNMSLPVHRWFRYSAGFSAQWVEQVLSDWSITKDNIILDPFVGSGTVSLVCDSLGIPSIGIEAHPTVARICKAKLLWPTSVERFLATAERMLILSSQNKNHVLPYPSLIERSFAPNVLSELNSLKFGWLQLNDGSPETELLWLCLTAILRSTSNVGTAQWQYILPNKKKTRVIPPSVAFRQQVQMIASDMRTFQTGAERSVAEIYSGNAAEILDSGISPVDGVITSPPYANNYDYADALRFEMTFWGDVNNWGDVHDLVRKHLIVSSSQHSSRDRLNLEDLLLLDVLDPIRDELTIATHTLDIVRHEHGGNKHYHTMVAAYFRDIGMVINHLRKVCKPGSQMCWVIGDSAPYGVHCPVERWIGQLALAAGFMNFHFDKLRDRNTKWKNRKHRVPLKEGLLWIEG